MAQWVKDLVWLLQWQGSIPGPGASECYRRCNHKRKKKNGYKIVRLYDNDFGGGDHKLGPSSI